MTFNALKYTKPPVWTFLAVFIASLMIFDCRRMFTNLCRHTARPPSELCDPLKGRSGDSTLSSSPRAKLRSAELDWGQVLDWKLAAAPSSHSISPISLSLFFFFCSLSPSHTQYQSLSIPSPSLSAPPCLPPSQCPTQQPLFPVLFELHGSWALGGCRSQWGAPFLWGGWEN